MLPPPDKIRYTGGSIVQLIRPGKVLKEKRFKGGWTYINVVKMKRFIYRSATYPEIIAYTYGDFWGNRVIKPFIILTHDWEQDRSIRRYSNTDYHWKCKKCKMSGKSPTGSKKSICPDELYSCDDMMIKDIIE
jgi:hypothetical protein